VTTSEAIGEERVLAEGEKTSDGSGFASCFVGIGGPEQLAGSG
jgi:hypothetical protein